MANGDAEAQDFLDLELGGGADLGGLIGGFSGSDGGVGLSNWAI